MTFRPCSPWMIIPPGQTTLAGVWVVSPVWNAGDQPLAMLMLINRRTKRVDQIKLFNQEICQFYAQSLQQNHCFNKLLMSSARNNSASAGFTSNCSDWGAPSPLPQSWHRTRQLFTQGQSWQTDFLLNAGPTQKSYKRNKATVRIKAMS